MLHDRVDRLGLSHSLVIIRKSMFQATNFDVVISTRKCHQIYAQPVFTNHIHPLLHLTRGPGDLSIAPKRVDLTYLCPDVCVKYSESEPF